MTHKQTIQARNRLLQRLSATSEILRGSLVERITHHSSGCPKCARGEGHPQTVLTISYPGGRTRQFSLRSEQVPQVRRWLSNYQELKGGNHAKPDPASHASFTVIPAAVEAVAPLHPEPSLHPPISCCQSDNGWGRG